MDAKERPIVRGHSAAPDDVVTIYWAPTCSNCMRLKSYVASRGVEFASVNVVEHPEQLIALEPLGVKTFPLITRGSRFVAGLDLLQVDELLGLTKRPSTISAPQIGPRMIKVVAAWARYAKQVPPETYDNVVPGLEGVEAFYLPTGEKFELADGRAYVPHGTYFRLIGHVLRHARRVRLILQEPQSDHLRDARKHVQFGEPLPEDPLDQLIADGEDIIRVIERWSADAASVNSDPSIETFHGTKKRSQLLLTELYSLTQHTRQLMTVLIMNGIAPDRPLDDADYRGLNLPDNVWH